MDAPTKETFSFQAEVGRILDIVAHSLYSQREIFLRELISNASDACDKLRYEALTKPELIEGDADFRITITADPKAKTLTVSDNGIGMSRDDLIEQLGTIAKSGTQAFLEAAEAQKQTGGEVTLIGQFGVGFYSAFMVADSIEVVSQRAGESQAWRWTSDGTGEFSLEPAERAERGTDVVVHLKKDAKEFLEAERLEHVVKTYSDHIGVPVTLAPIKDGDEEKTLNSASALWTRDKKDISQDQYKEFYHHVAHAFDDPWLTLHNRVEGVLSYTNLLFIPSVAPFDLFHPERKGHIKLYVKRVFITDDTEALLPPWLRFVRGIVDSEDLDLNVSREMLQMNPAVRKIRSGLTKKVLGELEKRAKKQDGDFDTFWETFGAVLKEGLYEDPEYRERILKLARFKSTAVDGWTSLADYKERMQDGQEAIYYITGEDVEHAAKSPQLEGFRAKGVEVLFMTDPVDEFWIPSVASFEETPFKSATRGGADLKTIGKDAADAADEETEDDDTSEAATEGVDLLIAAFKTALGDSVKDVRTTDRLTESACCLVADEGDMDIHLQRLLQQHKQLEHAMPRILEINPEHGLVKRLAALAADKTGQDPSLDEAAFLLLDQARIVEGETLPDPQAFAKRLAGMMEKGLA